ncbi:MAG: sulfotransferase [Gammaproteobacteria bacterium]
MAEESNPQVIQNMDNKKLQDANAFVSDEQYTQARLLYQELANDYPDNPEIRYLLGICLYQEKDFSQAMESFIKAIELNPRKPEYRVWLARCLELNGQRLNAIKVLESALELDPDNLEALSWKSKLHILNFEDKQAIKHLQHAVSLQPSNDNNLAGYALALGRRGRYEEALQLINKAIQITPKNADYYTKLGDIHRSNGNVDEAVRAYETALDIEPTRMETYHKLAATKKISDPNDKLIKEMERAISSSMTVTDRSYLLFALGKAYNNCKEWDKAFAYFDKANMLVQSKYDPTQHSKEVSRMEEIFNINYLKDNTSSQVSEFTPIFIVGMPRSGTTLTDQVLASHSRVHSVGESLLIDMIAHGLCQENTRTTEYPDCLADLSVEKLEAGRKLYIDEVSKEAGDAEFIIDKLPYNYLYLGLIYKLFPDAKIIHCMRSPLDNCLSCYFTRFYFSEYTWAHSLEYIGKYYRDYLKLMHHWHTVLPVPILDVQYENVVSDFESNARRIIEFCGLEWEPGCMEFYKTKRSVVTASVVQVRQPIYSSSVDRWVPYAKHLQPLVTTLGDVLKDDAPRLQELGLKANISQSLLQRLSGLFPFLSKQN